MYIIVNIVMQLTARIKNVVLKFQKAYVDSQKKCFYKKTYMYLYIYILC